MISRLSRASAGLLALTLGLHLSALPAPAASISLNPTADVFVSSANPTNNYGGAGSVAVSAPGLANGEFQSVVQFDLSSAKTAFDTAFGSGNWTVQSATLQLTAAVPMNSIFNASAAGSIDVSWMQSNAWTEGVGTPMAPGNTGLTFNTLPSFESGSDQALGAFSFDGSTAGTLTWTLTVGSGLLGDITGGLPASIRMFAADRVVSGLFNSRSFKTPSAQPVLTINAVMVPEPASWILAALGAAWVVIIKRRGMA